jgi:hypothetical protein
VPCLAITAIVLSHHLLGKKRANTLLFNFVIPFHFETCTGTALRPGPSCKDSWTEHVAVSEQNMGNSWSNKSFLALGLLAASRTASALPWAVEFGGCTFSGDYDGAPLVRSGSCPTQDGALYLSSRGITSVPEQAFIGMAKME